jgi:hypothetical protein
MLWLIPRSAEYLHWLLLDTVMRAKLWFYTSTDMGTVINRLVYLLLIHKGFGKCWCQKRLTRCFNGEQVQPRHDAHQPDAPNDHIPTDYM